MMIEIDTATKTVIAEMWAHRARSSALAIREVSLAIEERLPGVTLDEIHLSVNRVAIFHAAAQWAPERERQLPYAYVPPGLPESAARVWIYPRDDEEEG